MTCVQLRLDAPWRFKELWDELTAHVIGNENWKHQNQHKKVEIEENDAEVFQLISAEISSKFIENFLRIRRFQLEITGYK